MVHYHSRVLSCSGLRCRGTNDSVRWKGSEVNRSVRHGRRYIYHTLPAIMYASSHTNTHTRTRMYLHVCTATTAEYPVAAGLPEYVTWKTRHVILKPSIKIKKTPNMGNKPNETIIIIKNVLKKLKKCISL